MDILLSSARRATLNPMTRRLFIACVVFVAAGAFTYAADQRTVSILYFENTTKAPDYAWLSKGITDMLITDLAGCGELAVIEREDIEKVLTQQELSLSGIFDEKSAVRIGKLLSARQIVVGSYIVMKETLRADAKLVDVESGAVLASVQSSRAYTELFLLEKDLAAKLLAAMGVKAPAPAPGETASVKAAEAYYTGVGYLDTGAYAKAAEQFKQAAGLDPFYVKPRKSLEDAYRFLKDFKNQRYQRELNQLYLKAEQLKARLAAKEWLTYSDLITRAVAKGASADEINKIKDDNPAMLEGDTRAQCTWNLQFTLMDIANMAQEYFEDGATEDAMYTEIAAITRSSRVEFKGDPFLPEILYVELFSLQHFQQWDGVMQACEYLMTTYPDYRMMWAVEDFYQRALEKKGATSG